jgi:signal transduction histidine kinase
MKKAPWPQAVEDDGRGFDLATARTAGDGLAYLGDRLREIGGTTRIITAPNVGCRITLEVPRTS